MRKFVTACQIFAGVCLVGTMLPTHARAENMGITFAEYPSPPYPTAVTIGDQKTGDTNSATSQIGVGSGGAYTFGVFSLTNPAGGPYTVSANSNNPGNPNVGEINLNPVTITNTGSSTQTLRITVEDDFGFTNPQSYDNLLRLVEGFSASGLQSGDGITFTGYGVGRLADLTAPNGNSGTVSNRTGRK